MNRNQLPIDQFLDNLHKQLFFFFLNNLYINYYYYFLRQIPGQFIQSLSFVKLLVIEQKLGLKFDVIQFEYKLSL